jgi:uncharacterized protein YndB with AHSA1/START domain
VTERREPAIVVVRRVLPAPPAVVYDEWLDPDALIDWMCPLPARCTSVQSEPWVGGRLRIDIDDSGAVFVVTGRYLALDRPGLLSFTWSCSNWPDPALESVVTVTFEPADDERTLMTIEHTRLPDDLVDQHEQGWTSIAAQLEHELTPASA